MTKSFFIYRFACALLCILLLSSTLCLCIQADTVRDYSVVLDHPQQKSSAGSAIMITGHAHGTDPELVLSGWVETDLIMDHYAYTLDGGKTWIKVNAVIPREDVKHNCPSTYSTAGYHITIDVSELPDGKYDIFVRGFTTTGDSIDVLVMIDTLIGNVDTETVAYCQINLLRLGGEEKSLSMAAGESVSLGNMNLREMAAVEILTDSEATLYLDSDGISANPFSKQFDQVTQHKDGGYMTSLSLEDVTHAGEVLLRAESDALISQIRFYYETPDFYTEDLKIHLTATPYEFLTGMNDSTVSVQSDEIVGTYTKFNPTKDTVDPFVYINIDGYLSQTQDIRISADHYRYAVITAQSHTSDPNARFGMYLCSGAVRNPSESNKYTFDPIHDGQWHTYVLPLMKSANWIGQIYGIRFDYFEGSSYDSSEFINVASIGFYPDLESAQAAANAPLEVYHENNMPPKDKYKEQNRAPSGRADAITWFDDSLADCFGGENQASYSFDAYGHLLITATEYSNDPYVSFDMKKYAELTGMPMLKAEQHKTIVLRIMADEDIRGRQFVLYYYSGGFGYAEGSRAVGATYQGGDWEYLVYDMSKAELWTDEILGMRLDPAGDIYAGLSVCISDILFFENEDSWKTYAVQNGIIAEETQPTDTENTTKAPETERPSIEIPTQGPGLEYVPFETGEPEQTEPGQAASDGCTGALPLPIGFILPTLLILCFKSQSHNKNRKGDKS